MYKQLKPDGCAINIRSHSQHSLKVQCENSICGNSMYLNSDVSGRAFTSHNPMLLPNTQHSQVRSVWHLLWPRFTLRSRVLQECELLSRISDLQEEVSRRKKHIADLDHEIHTLNENISTLTKELELKGKEVLKIRSEANQQIRWVLDWRLWSFLAFRHCNKVFLLHYLCSKKKKAY